MRIKTLDITWSLPEDVFSLIAQTPLSAEPGKLFDYSLLSVAAGGYLIAKRLKPKASIYESYIEAVSQRVLQPLGMNRATFSIKDGEKNVAAGHVYQEHRWKKLPRWETEVNPLTPALGLKLCLEDAVAWMRFEMTLGKNVEKPLTLPDDLRRRWKPSSKSKFGMGWHNSYYQGSMIVTASGSYDHQSVMVGFFPLQKIAFVALLNTDGVRGQRLFQELPLSLAEIISDNLQEKK